MNKILLLSLLACVGMAGKIQGQTTWSTAIGSAWLTGGNWTGGSVPSTTGYARFGVNPTSVAGVGINMNNPTNNGTNNQAIGIIEVTSARTNAFLIGNSTTAANGTLTLNGNASNIVLLHNGSSTWTIQNTQGSGSRLMTVNLANTTENIVEINNGGTLNISSIISGNRLSLSTSATAGTLTLSGNNVFTGGFTLNAGTVNINNAAALGTAAGTFTINGGTINNTSGGSITTANYPQSWAGNFTFTGSNSLNLGTGAVNMTATRTVTVNASTLTVGGIISGSTFGLIKAGAGTLLLTGANTYTGMTTVNAGTLRLNRTGSNTIPATNDVSIEGGTLRISSNQTINNLTLSSGTLQIDPSVILTINGTYNATGGTINNQGTILFNNTSASFPGTSVTLNNGTANTLTNLTLNNGNTTTLTADFNVAGTLTNNGTLDCGTRTIGGVGAFTITTGATLTTAHASGVSGSITTSGATSWDAGANYIFNGTVAQNTGFRVDVTTINNLTINNSGGDVTLNRSISTAGTLSLTAGRLSIASNTLTLAGAVSGTGTLRGGSTSNLSISGAAGTLNFDQSTPGTTNVLNNLTLSGTGTATLGNALNVVGNVALGSATPSLTTGGNLTLKSTAANVHATITGGTNASISGNVNLERFVPAHTTGGYSFFGHPLQSNPTFAGVTDLGASTTGTVFYDETVKTVSGTSPQIANAWRGISATSAAIEQGRGYGQWTTTAKNLVFTGAPQLSDLTVNLSFTPGTYSLNGSTIVPGYNLLANPYPAEYPFSAISRTNAGATMYVWDKNNGPSGGYHDTGTLTHLAPGQAFFVLATSTGADVTFAAASRAASGAASMYRKAANAFILSYGQNWTDEMSVTFRDDATTGFDAEFDGRNLMGGPLNNEIYTLIDGTEYVLNNLPSAARSRSLALGIRVGTPGRMSLGYTPQEDEVILEDRLTGTLHNFERGAYTFTAEAGKHDNRFVLHFNARQINSQTADALEESFYAFGADNAVGVAFRQAGQSGEVTVLDLTGRAVAAPVQVTGTETVRIAVPQAAGLYLIRVRTAAGTAVKRVVVE